MHLRTRLAVGAVVMWLAWPEASHVGVAAEAVAAPVWPVAVLPFRERDRNVKELGDQVTDLLCATLSAEPSVQLLERADLDKSLSESELSLSGAVAPDQALQVGRLSGAKILVTGSVMQIGQNLHLVAKIIGTETSRVLGETVKGDAGAELDALVTELAGKVVKTITDRADDLVARPEPRDDRVAKLKAELGQGRRPTVYVRVTERHVGQATIDPAAQTELVLLCRESGFEVLDGDGSTRAKAQIAIEGEGFSEFALRRGNLVSVKARVELKATDTKTGQVVAADRQTAIVVDLSEQIAGKAALQQAAAEIASRLLPRLVQK
jgi:TolB-like protein